MSGRVLVTGANGFIGWDLLPRLIDAGHEVNALSRTSYAEAGRRLPLSASAWGRFALPTPR